VGHNSVVLILNDELHRIKADKDYGEKLFYAICSWDRNDEWSRRERVVGTTVLHEGHADQTVMLLAGGNQGKRIGSTFNSGRFWRPEDTDRAVKDILRYEGYRVSRLKKNQVTRSVIDEVADLTRPKQQDVLKEHAERLGDENRKLLVEVEALKARIKELGG
jgi:hypothetical protein